MLVTLLSIFSHSFPGNSVLLQVWIFQPVICRCCIMKSWPSPLTTLCPWEPPSHKSHIRNPKMLRMKSRGILLSLTKEVEIEVWRDKSDVEHPSKSPKGKKVHWRRLIRVKFTNYSKCCGNFQPWIDHFFIWTEQGYYQTGDCICKHCEGSNYHIHSYTLYICSVSKVQCTMYYSVEIQYEVKFSVLFSFLHLHFLSKC